MSNNKFSSPDKSAGKARDEQRHGEADAGQEGAGGQERPTQAGSAGSQAEPYRDYREPAEAENASRLADEKPENAPATAEPAKQPEGTPKNAPDQKPAVNTPK